MPPMSESEQALGAPARLREPAVERILCPLSAIVDDEALGRQAPHGGIRAAAIAFKTE